MNSLDPRRYILLVDPAAGSDVTRRRIVEAIAQASETGAVVVIDEPADGAATRKRRFRAAMDKLHAVEDADEETWRAAHCELERVVAENNAEEDAAARLLAVTYDGPRRPPPGRPGCPRCDGSGTATRTAKGKRVPGHRCPACRERTNMNRSNR